MSAEARHPLAKRLLLILVAVTVVCGGCDAVAHIKAVQPPSVRSSGTIVVPAAARATPGAFQRGIDIDLYTWRGENIPAAAAYEISYITSLHANAVSISFPYFMDGRDSNTVHATAGTPTPAQLAVVIRDAEAAGLYVSLRPLLDEASLGMSRVNWKPTHPATWFASYKRFVMPYVAMTQQQHVSEFFIGAEFRHLGQSHRWVALDAAVRRVYHGTLACSDNWDDINRGGCGPVTQTVDAYPPIPGNELTVGWDAYDALLPKHSVITEVDIAAASGAYDRPYVHGFEAPVDQKVQVRWFRAACAAAQRTHLGGLYFWSVGLGTSAGDGPTEASPLQWSGGEGARVISQCFAAIEKDGAA